MSKNPKKDNNGLIENPIDAEDFAYNIVHKYNMSWRKQVEIEAALNALASANSLEERARILEDVLI